MTKEIVFLSAMEEERHVIAQANAAMDAKGTLRPGRGDRAPGREFTMVRSGDVTLMDVSPNQLVSVAASLIPFLEHDDANRALMGSNMQRQAVPLLRTEPPFVGTGMEIGRGPRLRGRGRREASGIVESVDARGSSSSRGGRTRRECTAPTSTRWSSSAVEPEHLHQPEADRHPRAKGEGGEVIADGPATRTGELALGRNVLVAFMPWGGYNFEDSILISEQIVKDDIFTSIHIEEFECVARDTKLGQGGDHPRHPERRRGGAEGPRRAASSGSGPR